MIFSLHKFFKVLLAICFPVMLFAQDDGKKTLTFTAKVRSEAVDPLADVAIQVYEKDGNKLLATYTTPTNGNVEFVLTLYKQYLVTFSKKDFVSKRIWIDANVPGKESNSMVRYNMEELVYLYTLTSSLLGAELLDKPYDKMHYKAQGNEFVIDEAYKADIKKEVSALSPQAKVDLIKKLGGNGGDAASKETGKAVKQPFVYGDELPGFNLSGSAIRQLLRKNQPKADEFPLTLVTVSIESDGDPLTELKTDKKDGNFKVRLPYGHVYKVKFSHPSCLPEFLLIDAKIPADKYKLEMNRDLTGVPLVDKKSVLEDSAKYRFAFDKYKYDGKKMLVRDEVYFTEFQTGKNREYLDYQSQLRKQKAEAGTTTATATATNPEKYNFVTGKILSGNPASQPVKNVKIILVGDRGEPLQTCLSSNAGKFIFSNVLLDQSYTLKVDEADLKNLAGQKITIIDKNNKEVIVTTADEKGMFRFHLLNSDRKTFNMLSTDDENVLISGNLLAVVNNVTTPIANTKVQLVNGKGELLEKVSTNDFGTFVFTKLPPNQNFLIELAEGDPKLANLKVIITDQNGKEINSTVCNSMGKFKFDFLKADEQKLQLMEVEETALRMDLKGKLFKNASPQPLPNAKLDLVNEKQQVVQSTSTDNAGNFNFSKVPYAQDYSLNTPAQPMEKVILANSAGVVIKEYKTGGVVNVIKMPLLPAEQQKLTSVSMDDPWLKVTEKNTAVAKPESYVIPERVYFEVNDYKITNEGQVILDKVVQVMKSNPKIKIEISSHTDSQGSDEYNLELSKKRAKSAVDYVTSKGVANTRLSAVGYGETRLINKCPNGTDCTEEEHAQNRRLEFKVTYLN